MKNKEVWKFPLTPSLQDHIKIRMPKGAEILTFQVQNHIPCIWALVYPDAPLVERRFWFVGTGHPLKEVSKTTYIGTIQLEDGALIFHLFEEL